MAKTNDFECDGPIKTFLSRPINHALTAATNLLEQLVIAELHLDPARLLRAVAVFLQRSAAQF